MCVSAFPACLNYTDNDLFSKAEYNYLKCFFA